MRPVWSLVPPIVADPPSPMNPPSGCRFRTRCPLAMPVCGAEQPRRQEAYPGRWVARHLYGTAAAPRRELNEVAV